MGDLSIGKKEKSALAFWEVVLIFGALREVGADLGSLKKAVRVEDRF